MRFPKHVATLSVCVVALLAACGTADEVAGTDVAITDEPTDQNFADIVYESPLAEFLGQDVSRFDFDEAAMIAEQREVETRIAACMAKDGFEYTPMDPAQMMSFGAPPSDEFEPGSNAWIAKYGFGISTQRFAQSMVGDLVGRPDEEMFGPDTDIEDPNQEYIESLTEQERDAYHEALHGEPPDFVLDGEEPGEAVAFEPTGCQFESYRGGSSGPDGDRMQAFYQAFGDQIQNLHERIDADNRVVAFTAVISSCVAERGMEWTGIEDVYQQFEPKLNNLRPGPSQGGDPFEDAGLNPEEMSDRQLEEFFREMNRLGPEALAVLAEIQAEEIALAQAVIACGGGPFKEQEIRNEVRVEYERAFLNENADALVEYRGD